ncbi:redoxin domain-containing protein [Acidobacteriota bacterium]
MRRRFIIILGLFLISFSCSQPESGPSISGSIQVQGDLNVGTYYVGLYNLSRFYIGDPIEFLEQAEPDFTFDVEPGQYTVVVYTFGTEKLKQHILVPDNHTRIQMEITLPPKGIEGEIDSVSLIGDFNEWNQRKALALTPHDGRWFLEGDPTLQSGDKYNYLVGGTVVYDITQDNVEAVGKGAELRNIYSGNELLFDPSDYQLPVKKATVRVAGIPFPEEYVQLVEELVTFDRAVGGLLQKSDELNEEEYEEEYRLMIGRLDRMKIQFPEFFFQAILDKRLDSIVFAHPAFIEYSRLRNSEEVSAEDLAGYYASDRFVNYYTEHLELLKQLDPESVMVAGEFAGTVMILERFLDRSLELGRRVGIDPDHFYEFLIDFIKRSPHKNTCARILFDAGSTYARRTQKEKAIFMITLLKAEYADDFYVGQGWADKALASLNTSIGAQAPDFEIETLTGQTLKLSDFRGQFVFLDFWGVWCGPCKAETPNLVRLDAEIPDDRLQVIGIATLDPIDVLKKYIADKKIEFPNTLVTEEDDVIEDYGITSYPTTLLIDPEGLIMAKNLRGKRLTELVREKMQEYEQE